MKTYMQCMPGCPTHCLFLHDTCIFSWLHITYSIENHAWNRCWRCYVRWQINGSFIWEMSMQGTN